MSAEPSAYDPQAIEPAAQSFWATSRAFEKLESAPSFSVVTSAHLTLAIDCVGWQDWICTYCGFVNFARRFECYSCHREKAPDAAHVPNNTKQGRRRARVVCISEH